MEKYKNSKISKNKQKNIVAIVINKSKEIFERERVREREGKSLVRPSIPEPPVLGFLDGLRRIHTGRETRNGGH